MSPQDLRDPRSRVLVKWLSGAAMSREEKDALEHAIKCMERELRRHTDDTREDPR